MHCLEKFSCIQLTEEVLPRHSLLQVGLELVQNKEFFG